ncbi:MAG: GDP-mannose 4,6-dehydratase [Deltaproteobacteria bacterium]|nr:GDP-mannose 4,6-dehydratase [Deltaproteobacteria bacterium]MBW2697638.1 GDP-mannose 4,6-dehydratase [Deltaproteobacteria bacterium]
MRVLVTGANGFVGRRLQRQLGEASHEVFPCDRDTVDVSDPGSVDRIVAETAPEAVIHLAAISFVPDSVRDPTLTYRVNFLGARNLIDSIERLAPGARVLLIGSGDQYAPMQPGGRPRRETDPLMPRSPYARTKAAAEQLGGLATERGLAVVRVRAFNHTGPGQEPRFVAPDFARQIAAIAAGRQAPEMRVGNLASVRDFLHVADVVDAYLRLLDPGVPSTVYNVASGRGTPIGELLEVLGELAGVEPHVEVEAARFRPADALVGDPTRLREATGWTPQHSLRDTLRELLEFWKANDAGGHRAQA